MLIAATNWDPARIPRTRDEVLLDLHTSHYVVGWASDGDRGVLALHAPDRPIGAAWLRLFTATEPGYGFVSHDVPEMSLAVVPQWRGKGVGRALLAEIVALAKRSGYARLSLSVERANYAHRLYTDEGFTVVESGPHSDTMVKALTAPS